MHEKVNFRNDLGELHKLLLKVLEPHRCIIFNKY